MKILVPLKRVPDYAVKPKIAPDGRSVQSEGTKWIINPFDEIAVEEAIRIKEKRPDTEVVVMSIGPSASSEQIRTALAMGADRGILVQTDKQIDSELAHRVIAEIVRKEGCQLVIMGKQSIDSDASQTGQLLAARLEWSQATFASKLALSEDWSTAEVTREVDGGLETIQIQLPAIVTTDLRLNEPRYPSLPGIVKAKKKPLEEIAFDTLCPGLEPSVRVVALEYPTARSAGVKVSSVAELVEKLHVEAKVF